MLETKIYFLYKCIDARKCSFIEWEISVVEGVHADILGSFSYYRLLKETDGQSRCKRKMNVYKMGFNQDTLMHVVEESISILNVSRMEIKENRPRINDLLMLIGSVEDKVNNMSNHLEQEIWYIPCSFLTCAIVRQDKGW